MISLDIRKAIQRIYTLNDACPENTDVFVFPFETFLFDALIKTLKSYNTEIFMPKDDVAGLDSGNEEDSNDDICPYVICRAPNDDGGYMIYVFVSELQIDRCEDAVRRIMVGEEPE